MMRRNQMWITLLFCLTSNCALGFFGTADEYAIMLTSNEPLDVRYAAELMHKKFNGNSRVNDIAAKRLWDELNTSPTLDESTTAWLVKAVGGTGSLRYQALLQQVLSGTDKKARYWAKLGLRRMAIHDVPFSPSAVDLDRVKKELDGKLDPINRQFQNTLASASGRKLRQEAERMFYLVNVLAPETLLIAADILEKSLDTEEPELTKALSWICRTLGRTKNPHYRASLLAAKERGNRKVSAWAEKSLQQLPSGNGD
jgi:hypothetical protein